MYSWAEIIESSLESQVFVGNSLIALYAKCGSIEDACRRSVPQYAISRCGHLECHGIGACEMWARAEDTGFISTNETGRYAQTLLHTFMLVLNANLSKKHT